MPQEIDILVSEVGPRDGLQSIKRTMPTEAKLHWIKALASSGLREIEVGSFVSPRLLPQMADCGMLVRESNKIEGLTVLALVPNLKGAENAVAAGARKLTMPPSASRAHSLNNIGMTPEEAIEDCTNIVALAGAEQIQQALATGADIIIAGRTTDTAIIAALPLVRGCHKGAAWHGAKIAECGALATTNPNSGVILMEFDQTGFTIIPMSDNASATPQTVSAHMLYENSDPFILYEPGGYLDVTDAHYHSVAERSVRVEGSRWHDTTPYYVKVEGARISGYQTVSFVLVRDSDYVSHIDQWVSGLETVFASKMYDNGNNDVALEMRIIGKNATLGALETDMASTPELGIMAIFTAPTQAKANEAAKILNPHLLHMPLTEKEPMPTLAFPFSPAETDRGPLYEFCLHHVCELDTPMAWFSLDVIEVKADG